MNASRESLFSPDGPDTWLPGELTRGPWDPRHCHGGPVGALLARAVERAETTSRSGAVSTPTADVEWQVARLTIELTRPVPVGRRLQLTTRIERPGKRVSLVGVTLTDDGVEVARARGLRLRRAETPLPPDTIQPADDPPGTPGSGSRQRATWAVGDLVAFHTDGCEHRFTRGGWEEPGPTGVWIRLLVDVVPGETPSGVQRAVAAADFGNGVSGSLPYDDFTYINPDLTVHLLRPPVGEWIGMRTASYYGSGATDSGDSRTGGTSTGSGLAESALYDADGRLGRSVQSLLIAAR